MRDEAFTLPVDGEKYSTMLSLGYRGTRFFQRTSRDYGRVRMIT